MSGKERDDQGQAELKPGGMSFAAVFLPEFPVQAWRQRAPALRGASLVLLEGVAPGERVFSLSAAARAKGVEHGMSRVQAEAASPELLRARDMGEEERVFRELCRVAERFSPRVEAVGSPANGYAAAAEVRGALLLLDRSGMYQLFGSAEAYAERLHAELAGAGFVAARVATAPNAAAASVLARAGRHTVCVATGELAERLAPLPVSLLPCEPRLRQLLARWGIRTFGELARLPETALISRLGQGGRRLQLLARGEAEHLLVPEEPAFTLRESLALDSSLVLLDSLLFVLSPMLEALLCRAMERAYALRRVRLTLQLEGIAQAHVLEVRPAVPTSSRDLLLKLLNLELQARPPRGGIVGVRLQAESAEPPVAQRGLFQTDPEPDRLDLLLARLRSIAGEDRVGSPVLRDTHGEDAFTVGPFEPVVAESSTAEGPGAAGATVSIRASVGEGMQSPDRLAIRMLRPPQPVRVTVREERPETLYWQGSRMPLVSATGPWHSSGCWWNGESWDHAAWDITVDEPRMALHLRQEHGSGAWFVVGVYD